MTIKISDIPVCIITGKIAGDPDACGDCDPCFSAWSVPEVLKRLINEKEEWRRKYSDVMGKLDEQLTPPPDPV